METGLGLHRSGWGSGEPPHHGQSEDHVQVSHDDTGSCCQVSSSTLDKAKHEPCLFLALKLELLSDLHYFALLTWKYLLHVPQQLFVAEDLHPCPTLPVNSANKGNKGKVGRGEEWPWGVSYCRTHWGRWTNTSMLGRTGRNLEVRSKGERNCFSLTSTTHEAWQMWSSLGLTNVL